MKTNISAPTMQLAMLETGISCNDELIADNEFHRFYLAGDKRDSKNGWYKLFNNTIPIGVFGSWKTQEKYTWHSPAYENLRPLEQAAYQRKTIEAKAQADEEVKRLRALARERANTSWQQSSLAPDNHPYLLKKQVKALSIRLRKDGALVIPLQDNQGIIHSLQYIKSDGSKRFLRDGAIKGHYYQLGLDSNTVYLCEGYATAATIWQATQAIVVAAFNAGNLLAAARAIRLKYPTKQLVICADNDQFNPQGNIGLEKATEAANTVNGYLIKPQFEHLEAKPTDFNDLYLQQGLASVCEQLTQTISINEPEKLNQRPSQASLLLDLLTELELFHDQQKEAYATFSNGGHKETWPIDGKHFRDWLAHTFWSHYQKAINSNALQDVINTLTGKALFEGKIHRVFSRVGLADNKIYIDLANEGWDIIEVSADDWQLLKDCPLKFKRLVSMQPLPTPIKNGDINKLWRYINVPKSARKLITTWLVECLRPDTHFPLLVLTGLQGSAKSTTQNILRNLIDPSTSNLRNAPKKSEDILIAAANNWLVSFNNLSNLTAQQQDDLCCLATGGGFATRRLFTTSEEAIVDIKRPVILNGINDLVTAQDLIDRCIIVELPAISAEERKNDKELQAAFNSDYPAIFGGLLDALAGALKHLSTVKLLEKPRMADFAYLGTALEKTLGWPKGSFLQDYQQNREESITQAMEHSPIAVALLQFMETRTRYTGAYCILYKLLTEQYKPDMSGWPKSPKGLANMLKRQAPALSLAGITIEFDSIRKNDGYHLTISRQPEKQVHYVHQVHQPSTDLAYPSELSQTQVRSTVLSSLHVHGSTPNPDKASALGVHSELINLANDRELITL
jgi:phage/plasmid primase-like uncharacterized protein